MSKLLAAMVLLSLIFLGGCAHVDVLSLKDAQEEACSEPFDHHVHGVHFFKPQPYIFVTLAHPAPTTASKETDAEKKKRLEEEIKTLDKKAEAERIENEKKKAQLPPENDLMGADAKKPKSGGGASQTPGGPGGGTPPSTTAKSGSDAPAVSPNPAGDLTKQLHAELIYLPGEEYVAKPRGFWGTTKETLAFNTNGTLSSFGGENDSKIPETITAFAGILSAAAGVMKPASASDFQIESMPPDDSKGAPTPEDYVGLYRIVMDRSGCIRGFVRVPLTFDLNNSRKYDAAIPDEAPACKK